MSFVLFLVSWMVIPASGLPAVVPEDLGRLDPLLVELVEQRVAAVRASPADAGAHGDLGLVYEANRLWTEARASFENAVRLAPEDLSWRFHLALTRRQTGDFDGALALYRTLAAEHPGFAPAAQRLGEALLEAGELAAARAQFARLIELAPRAPHGHAGLGDALLRQGDAAAAAEALERAVELAPHYRTARYLLGTAYLRLGRRDDAERELARGVDARIDYLPDPLAPRLERYAVGLTDRLERAGTELARGRPERAVELLEEARTAHPANVTLLNNLAIAYLRLGRLDDAHELLEEARRRQPERFSTYLNLSSWALRAGRLDEALDFADAAVARAPDLSRPHFTRAQILARGGRFEEALASIGRALERDAGNPPAEAFTGDLHLRLGRLEAARVHYRRALDLAPDFLPAWVGLARASAALDAHDDALAALAEARRIAPRHPLVLRLERELEQQ